MRGAGFSRQGRSQSFYQDTEFLLAFRRRRLKSTRALKKITFFFIFNSHTFFFFLLELYAHLLHNIPIRQNLCDLISCQKKKM